MTVVMIVMVVMMIVTVIMMLMVMYVPPFRRFRPLRNILDLKLPDDKNNTLHIVNLFTAISMHHHFVDRINSSAMVITTRTHVLKNSILNVSADIFVFLRRGNKIGNKTQAYPLGL